MRWIRFLLRLPLVVVYAFIGILIIVLMHLLAGKRWFQRDSGKLIIRRYMRFLSLLIGLRIHVHGTPQVGLIVANHISWLDIIALDAVLVARFVSKDEVMAWPVVGLLPKWSGTFFLQRGSAAAVGRLNNEIVEALHERDTVAVFPEGTTHNGEQVHRFYSAILQTGIDAGVPVQAVAIRYLRDGQRDTLAPFIDNEGFFTHVMRILGAKQVDVYLDFCDAFVPHDMTRKQLSEQLYLQIKDVFDTGSARPTID